MRNFYCKNCLDDGFVYRWFFLKTKCPVCKGEPKKYYHEKSSKRPLPPPAPPPKRIINEDVKITLYRKRNN